MRKIFRRARAGLVLALCVWTLAVIFDAWTEQPQVRLYYDVPGPGAAPVKAAANRICDDRDARLDLGRLTRQGNEISVDLCFKATEVRGKMLVPYREAAADGIVAADNPYSANVLLYTAAYAARFAVPEEAEKGADDQWREQRWEIRKTALLFLFGGWLTMWLGAFLIGRGVRKLMGIPADRHTGKRSGPVTGSTTGPQP